MKYTEDDIRRIKNAAEGRLLDVVQDSSISCVNPALTMWEIALIVMQRKSLPLHPIRIFSNAFLAMRYPVKVQYRT